MNRHLATIGFVTLVALGGISQNSPLNVRLAKAGANQPPTVQPPIVSTNKPKIVMLIFQTIEYSVSQCPTCPWTSSGPRGFKVYNESVSEGVIPVARTNADGSEKQGAEILAQYLADGYEITDKQSSYYFMLVKR